MHHREQEKTIAMLHSRPRAHPLFLAAIPFGSGMFLSPSYFLTSPNHDPTNNPSTNFTTLNSFFRKKKKKKKNGGCSMMMQESSAPSCDESSGGKWAGLPPELLGEIIRRLESSEDEWPQRQSVVVCGCVCKRWREAVKDAVETASLHQPWKITFPSSLKMPGPREAPVQCLVKRDRKSSTFYLYLQLTPSLTDEGKFLLAARRDMMSIGLRTTYIITLDAADFSPTSKAYVGKLRSDLLRLNFTIYDRQAAAAADTGTKKPSSSIATKQMNSPQLFPAGNFKIGVVSYKFGAGTHPRRMACSLVLLRCTTSSSSSSSSSNEDDDDDPSSSSSSQMKKHHHHPAESYCTIILKNKTPRWDESKKIYHLNFRRRVSMPSVRNFQLLLGGESEAEEEVLQFGKVGEDTYTMDYRHPLSAFQAFAICLSSFGNKLA